MILKRCYLYQIISYSSKCLTQTTVVLVIVNIRGISANPFFFSMHHFYTVIDVNGTLFHIFVKRLASMHTTRINQI